MSPLPSAQRARLACHRTIQLSVACSCEDKPRFTADASHQHRHLSPGYEEPASSLVFVCGGAKETEGDGVSGGEKEKKRE